MNSLHLTSAAAGLSGDGDAAAAVKLSCPASRLNRLQKLQQFGVDLIRMRSGKAMRQTRIIDLLRAFDELGRFLCRVVDRLNLIVFCVHDLFGDIEFLEVL